KLAKVGRVYATEPYLSWLSYPMYKLLHHDPVDLSIHRPVLDTVQGPLSTSNQAMPHMIFFQRPDWLAELTAYKPNRAQEISSIFRQSPYRREK
ncbi:hypothetical protein AB9F38_33265, partial [Rhizobium leguminosarum]